MLFKNALLVLAAAAVTAVSAQKINSLSSDFDTVPACPKQILQETPSTLCGTTITPECYCKDGAYLMNVAASRGEKCSEAEGKEAFNQHCAMCFK